ncbi:FkbM family methyltransferase [Hydrogenophaga sp.]|uniref:FkbM family methyltransferase n=1 Tax=Hydrogenophaga sp. TaxID=1904254 RepID=UPI0035B04C41
MFGTLHKIALSWFRKIRIIYRHIIGVEPKVYVTHKVSQHYHGNSGYGGWSIPDGILNSESIVVDIGLGEDISFSESLIATYGCQVYGFDPTPRSIKYVRDRSPKKFHLYALGVAGTNRITTFFLPNISNHISGSIIKSNHVGNSQVNVELIDLTSLLELINKPGIDLLKIDIEGAEYELLESSAFKDNAHSIKILCIEFHHRWKEIGPQATLAAVASLRKMGFECIWQANETNEEFTFLNTSYIDGSNA